MGKLVCGVMQNDAEILRVITTLAGSAPYLAKTTPGVGKPYWYWEAIPAGKVTAADFTDAPLASADVATNKTAIAAITAQPQDVLTYDPPLPG
jgi:hypothetical protein